MLSPALAGVFANAALPQKLVLIALLAAVPLTVILALLALRGGAAEAASRRVVENMRLAAPAAALLTAGLSSFHMGETIMRLPFDATLKQLAPGIFEVSALVSLGALVGLLAVIAHVVIGVSLRRRGPA